MGVDTSSIAGALGKVDEFKHQAEALATVPDRFNHHFRPLGWIVHGDIGLAVAREAITLGHMARYVQLPFTAQREVSPGRLREVYSPAAFPVLN